MLIFSTTVKWPSGARTASGWVQYIMVIKLNYLLLFLYYEFDGDIERVGAPSPQPRDPRLVGCQKQNWKSIAMNAPRCKREHRYLPTCMLFVIPYFYYFVTCIVHFYRKQGSNGSNKKTTRKLLTFMLPFYTLPCRMHKKLPLISVSASGLLKHFSKSYFSQAVTEIASLLVSLNVWNK